MACRSLRRQYCFNLIRSLGYRNLSTEQAVDPKLDETVRDGIETNQLKPRKHPGVIKIGTCSLPEHIIKAISIVADDHPKKAILQDAKVLTNYLHSRHYPWEVEDLQERRRGFIDNVKSRLGELPTEATEEQTHHYNKLVKSSVTALMMKYGYKWNALDLNDYSCLVYMFTRAAPNYAAVLRVFHEITKLCPDYKPTSLFDFGSGLGTVSWAAKTLWEDSLKEYMNIDSSSHMNDLAELLLLGGDREKPAPLNVYFREFLPAQHVAYSVAVCAHSLMELPSREARLNLLLNLWHKTKDFLVIVEQGTKPGFKLVLEARDFILSLSNEKHPAHVFAPCPHDGACPRHLRGPYPCHFQVKYFDILVGRKQEIKRDLFSYVIIRKGRREEGMEWPRVVRPVLQRHNHVICRLCTAHTDLREVIFTKNKHGKVLYKCAKVTNWGDRLPVQLAAASPQECQPETSDKDPKPD